MSIRLQQWADRSAPGTEWILLTAMIDPHQVRNLPLETFDKLCYSFWGQHCCLHRTRGPTMPNYFMHAVVPWTDLFSVRTLMAARSVASTVPPSASLALESSSKSQGWLLCPLTPWALTASFLYWRSLASKKSAALPPCPVFP